jgi:nitrate reductase NapAB chaperone NapD
MRSKAAVVITGLIVKTIPERLHEVLVALKNSSRIRTARIMDEEKILTIIITKDIKEEAVVSEEIRRFDGVKSINLAYHHFERREY